MAETRFLVAALVLLESLENQRYIGRGNPRDGAFLILPYPVFFRIMKSNKDRPVTS